MKTAVLLVVVAAVTSTAYEQVRFSPTVVSGGCSANANRSAAIQQTKQDLRNVLSNLTNGTCDGTRGWNRIAYLDMSIPTTQCPGIWREVVTSSTPVRACGGAVLGDRACDSNVYPNTNGITYSQVCGRMVGYQLSAPDAFRPYHNGHVTTIEAAYLDGVSLTHGAAGSRQHIWSFAVGESERSSTFAACPCNANASITVPPFVGSDYFCESGVSMTNCSQIYFGSDPLWDGMSCNPSNTCCDFNTPPYFTKTLPSPTTDDLEVRLCSYDDGCESDIAVSFIELYVK